MASAIVGALVALAVSLLNDREHSATAWLMFEDPGSELAVGTPRSGAGDPATEAATRERFASTSGVRNLAAELSTEEVSAESLADDVEVSAGDDSDLLSVRATDSSAEGAAELANAFAQGYIRFNDQTIRGTIAAAQQRIERALEESEVPEEGENVRRQELEGELARLDTLEAVQGGNPRLVEDAEGDAADQSSRHVARNALIGAGAGALVGLALLLVRGARPRLYSPGAIARAYGMPLLGAIPKSRSLARSRKRAEGRAPAGSAAEAFALLRARLSHSKQGAEARSVLVTARAPREGTTTVAWHLAMGLAENGEQVFLLEANLRHPVLGGEGELGLAPVPGLAEVLSGEVPIERAVQVVAADSGRDADDEPDDVPRLDVLTAGHVPPHPAELLAGRPMARLVEELARAYDVVVIDAPPVGSIADAIPLLGLADEVIVVAAAGASSTHEAAAFADGLRRLGVATAVLVANRVRSLQP